jgi:hypothetical protein
VHVAEPTGFHDAPIALTTTGRAAIDLADLDRASREVAATAPHLPMVRDGREPFPASSDGDAPIGAVLDLTDKDLDHPGWWQRQSDQWVPVRTSRPAASATPRRTLAGGPTEERMNITQHQLDRTDLVVLVGHERLVEWSSHRDRDEVADMLRKIADGIEAGTL